MEWLGIELLFICGIVNFERMIVDFFVGSWKSSVLVEIWKFKGAKGFVSNPAVLHTRNQSAVPFDVIHRPARPVLSPSFLSI